MIKKYELMKALTESRALTLESPFDFSGLNKKEKWRIMFHINKLKFKKKHNLDSHLDTGSITIII